MTKDAALLTENTTETPKVVPGQSLDDIIKSDRKKNNKKGRGRGKGKGRGRGKKGRGRGRGRGFRKRGGYGGRGMYGRGRGFYTPAFRQMQSAGVGVMMNGRQPQQRFAEPLQAMYQLVSKHGLNPTIAVLQTSSENGRSTVQVQVDLDISGLEGKPVGSFGLRQLAWGHSKQDAKRKAVSQMLTHPAIQNLIGQLKPLKQQQGFQQNSSTSLFPSMKNNQPKRKKKNNPKKNKKKNKVNKGSGEYAICWDFVRGTCKKEDCKWKHEIPASLWKKNADRAITLFEAFMTKNAKLLSFEFTADAENEEKFTATCVVDGNNEGEGKGSRFEAKVQASKNTYEKFLAAVNAEKEAKKAAEETPEEATEETPEETVADKEAN